MGEISEGGGPGKMSYTGNVGGLRQKCAAL